MDRRTFVLLTGATSGALIRPPVRPTHSPTGAGWRSGGPAVGGLRVELDDHRRWALWDYGDGSPLPLVPGAQNVAWGGGPPLTLAELGDSTGGKPPPPGGGALVEPRRRGPHPRESRPCDRVRRRRARRGPGAIVAGRARSGERLAPGTAAPPRRRRLPHAPVLPPRGRRPGGAARAVRAILARRPGAPRTGRGARGVVHAGRVVGHRRRSGRDHQSGLQRRAFRPTILPAHRARRRLPASHRRVGSQRTVPARPRLAHRPDSRPRLQGGPLGRAVRRGGGLRRPHRAARLATARCDRTRRM